MGQGSPAQPCGLGTSLRSYSGPGRCHVAAWAPPGEALGGKAPGTGGQEAATVTSWVPWLQPLTSRGHRPHACPWPEDKQSACAQQGVWAGYG